MGSGECFLSLESSIEGDTSTVVSVPLQVSHTCTLVVMSVEDKLQYLSDLFAMQI